MNTSRLAASVAILLASIVVSPSFAFAQPRKGEGSSALPPELEEARRATQGVTDPLAAKKAQWKTEVDAGLAEQTAADAAGLAAIRARYENELAAKETPVLRYLNGRLLGKIATQKGADRSLLALARKEFARSLALDEKFFYGHEGLALCAVFDEDLESAVTEYREVVKAAPAHGAARCALARLLIAQGAVREARDHFAAVPETAPEWAEARIGQAETELRLGMAASAVTQFEAVRKKDPENLRAAYGLAQAQVVSGHPEAAEATYADILAKRPDEVAADFFLARLQAARGDMSGAAARLESLVSRMEARITRGEAVSESFTRILDDARSFLEDVKSGKAAGPQPKTIEEVVTILESSTDPESRRRAMRTLAKVRNPEVFKAIARALLDPDHGVRILAVREVAERGGPDAAKVVRNLLKDENALVRAAAADALGKLKNPLGTEALVGALRDKDADVRDASIRALSAISGREDPVLFEREPSPEAIAKSIAGWEAWWAQNRDEAAPARD